MPSIQRVTGVLVAFALALIACSPFGELRTKDDSATTAAPALPRATSSKADSSQLPAADAGADAGADATEGALTCSSRRSKQGTFGVSEVHSDRPITPVDVYATRDGGSLAIVLTQSAQACDLRRGHLTPASVNELAVVIDAKDTSFPPDDYFSEGEDVSLTLKAVHFDCAQLSSDATIPTKTIRAHGVVHIETHSSTTVEGNVDVFDGSGNETKFTFSAPICDSTSLIPADIGTCCGGN